MSDYGTLLGPWRDDGNLTPPVQIYNTSLASSIITISGLPLGIVAIVINAILAYCKFGAISRVGYGQ